MGKGGGEFYTYIAKQYVGEMSAIAASIGVSRLRYNETYAQTGRIVPSPIHLYANLSRKLHGGNKQIHTRQLFCNFSDFYVPIRDLR